MPVEISINWHFVGDGEDAHVSYHVSGTALLDEEAEDHDEEGPAEGRVLPLGSSVIAPGLSMPVGAP